MDKKFENFNSKMSEYKPFQKHIAWKKHTQDNLGKHIEYCETHIEKRDIVIAEQKGIFPYKFFEIMYIYIFIIQIFLIFQSLQSGEC